MKTKVLHMNADRIDDHAFDEASDILRNGGLVAFPTETVYGLGGDGLNPQAAEKIYKAKGRPSDNPLIVHIADMDGLGVLTDFVPEKARLVAEEFWPGPLTMIFRKSSVVPYGTTGGLDTVAVRMPGHSIALGLIRSSGVYIAAPSANTSGRPSPTLARHVHEDLDGRVDMIIDGGPVGIGVESTILDMSEAAPVILRPGFITPEMLQPLLGEVLFDPAVMDGAVDSIPKAPGMKYKHYAPKADLIIFEGSAERVAGEINRRAQRAVSEGKRVGIIAARETEKEYCFGTVKGIGTRSDEITIAQHLYAVLREFDEEETDVIFTESFDSGQLGRAIMNRLLKAAGYQIIRL